MTKTEIDRIHAILDILWNHDAESFEDLQSDENKADCEALEKLGFFNDLIWAGIGTREGESLTDAINFYLTAE